MSKNFQISLRPGHFDWEQLLKIYHKHAKANSKVIEIGASDPNRTCQLLSSVKEIIGIDNSFKRIPKVKQKNLKYLLCDWQNLSKKFTKNSFNILVASHVLEHVPNDLKALNQSYDVLKKGGLALLNTPNRRRLSRLIMELFTGPRHFPWWEHVREYSWEDLNRLIKKSKFKKYKITPLVFGFHNGYFQLFFKKVPKLFSKYANYWQIELYK